MRDTQTLSQNLYQWVADAAQRYPDTVAIQLSQAQPNVDGPAQWTYPQLAGEIRRLAHWLSTQDLQRGDCVGLLLYNDPLFVMAYFALLALGITVVPLNVRLTAEELSAILTDAQAKALISDQEFVPVLEGLAVETLQWVLMGGPDTEEENTLACPLFFWSEIQKMAIPEELPPEFGQDWPEEPTHPAFKPAVLIYTSGTTGVPKGVMLTHRSLGADAQANAQVICAVPQDVFVTISPMFHVFGQVNILLTAFRVGATVTLLKKFSPKAVLETIERHRVTFMAAVPTMYLMMLTHLESPSSESRFDLSSLRVCHSGASPMAREVFRRVEAAFGAPVQEGYGLSEASSIVTSNPLYEERKPGSIGLPLPGVSLKVVDEAGAECLSGEIGEILIQGPIVMSGYYGRPDLSAKTLRDGWLRTRDMAYRDEDGYVFIVDRQDDLMNIGGVKVYPREIEEVLFKHPDIQAAAVVSIASDLYGEEIKAFIVLKEAALKSPPAKTDIQRYCREHLAEFKIPKHIELVETIPQGATGKVLRKNLRLV